MSTSTWPSATDGSGTSRSSRTSAPPLRSNQIAFTRASIERRRQPAPVLRAERMLVPELAEQRDHRLSRPFRVVADATEQKLERPLVVAGGQRLLQLRVLHGLCD